MRQESSSKIHRRKFKPSRLVRFGLAALCLVAAGVLWLLLAEPNTPGKIFGFYSARSFTILLVSSYTLAWGVYYALNRQPHKTKLVNFIISTTGVVLAIVVFELAAILGIIDYNLVFAHGGSNLGFNNMEPWLNPTIKIDDDLIYRRRPNQRLVGESKGDIADYLRIPTGQHYQFDVKYDANGFRNDHEIVQAPIIVIGDSFAVSTLTPQKSLLSSHLSRIFGVEVANLGQMGYGPEQELIILQQYGLKVHPKLVVWLFFEGNDLRDLRVYDFIKEDWPIGKYKYRSFSYNVLRLLSALTSPYPHPDPEGDRSRRLSGVIHAGLDKEPALMYFGLPWGDTLTKADVVSLEDAKNYLRQAQLLSQNEGAQFLLVYVPTKYRVYQEFTEFPDDSLLNDVQLSDLPSRIENWSDQEGIPFLDLTPVLRESAENGDLVFFLADAHWNAHGNQVAANAISEFIQVNGLLRSGDR